LLVVEVVVNLEVEVVLEVIELLVMAQVLYKEQQKI
tara:strand:+ start:36 stop:143 length:108 start_codon:yes stop_codon:yes gene_type:complete